MLVVQELNFKKLFDLGQPCDDTLSESYCPTTPQKHTIGIVTDFVEQLCHQSSKPTSQTSLY